VLRSFLTVLFLLFTGLLLSQDLEDKEDKIPAYQKNDSSYVLEFKKKNFRFTPFIAPSASPELGLLISGGGLMSFRLEKENPVLQTSSIPFSFGISSTGAILANVRSTLFFREDKNRLSAEIWYKNMPDNYWGIGYEAARSPSEPDSTTSYNREWFQFLAKYTHRFGKKIFVGILVDFNETIATDLNEEMANDPDFNTNPNNNSIGILFQYDTRDFTVNAYEGLFFEFSSNLYKNEAFGDNEYGVFVLDYRQYRQVGHSIKKGRTLAWQIKTRIGYGDVPWSEMSLLGSPTDLRGYYWGRYRDMTMALGLLEYRYFFLLVL